MTADYIAFHALERPDAVALLDRGRPITYAAFDRDLRKLVRAAAEFGLPRGGSVAVGSDDLYTHWLLLLAFERLGIATVSFNSVESLDTARLLAGVDLVLAEPHFSGVPTRAHRAIAREWLARVLAPEESPDEHLPVPSPDDPVRLLRTSGTTGSPKRILHPRSLHEAWVTRWIMMAGLSYRTRFLLTMSFTVNGIYACATACLRAGGTVVLAEMPEARDIARVIADRDINALILAPIQIGRVLDELPPGFAKPASLTLCSFGAAVSSAMRRRACERLATELIDMYGSNEAGFIASTAASRDDGTSTIWPGVRVEIVDDHDRTLPRGQAGHIRVQTPDMAQGYLGDSEATRRMFRDGWFYPGDVGILRGSRGLQILGRGDDLLNLGGHKLPPEALEQAILKAVTVGDVGVCSARTAEGLDEILIALVDAQGDDRDLVERLTQALAPFRFDGFRATKLPAIPRNANGKIQRDLLRSALMEAMRGR